MRMFILAVPTVAEAEALVATDPVIVKAEISAVRVLRAFPKRAACWAEALHLAANPYGYIDPGELRQAARRSGRRPEPRCIRFARRHVSVVSIHNGWTSHETGGRLAIGAGRAGIEPGGNGAGREGSAGAAAVGR